MTATATTATATTAAASTAAASTATVTIASSAPNAASAGRSLTHPDAAHLYRCACGHTLRVSGGGRHSIYFERTGQRFDDPVMNGVCPACQLGLPGKNH